MKSEGLPTTFPDADVIRPVMFQLEWGREDCVGMLSIGSRRCFTDYVTGLAGSAPDPAQLASFATAVYQISRVSIEWAVFEDAMPVRERTLFRSRPGLVDVERTVARAEQVCRWLMEDLDAGPEVHGRVLLEARERILDFVDRFASGASSR